MSARAGRTRLFLATFVAYFPYQGAQSHHVMKQYWQNLLAMKTRISTTKRRRKHNSCMPFLCVSSASASKHTEMRKTDALRVKGGEKLLLSSLFL